MGKSASLNFTVGIIYRRGIFDFTSLETYPVESVTLIDTLLYEQYVSRTGTNHYKQLLLSFSIGNDFYLFKPRKLHASIALRPEIDLTNWRYQEIQCLQL